MIGHALVGAAPTHLPGRTPWRTPRGGHPVVAGALKRGRRYPQDLPTRFLTPRWLGLHALMLVSLGALGAIGWWQLEKARGDGNWQNYGYAVQWWLFGAFALFLWGKLILDELDPGRVEARR